MIRFEMLTVEEKGRENICEKNVSTKMLHLLSL